VRWLANIEQCGRAIIEHGKERRSLLSHATLEEIRIRAVQRVEAGESPEVVVKALGFSRPRIYEWLALYREGGLEALRAKPVPGAKPKLEGKALDWLYRTIAVEPAAVQIRVRIVDAGDGSGTDPPPV
jgi:transposase